MNRLESLKYAIGSLFSGKSHPVVLTLLLTMALTGFYGCRSTKDVVRQTTEKDVKRLEEMVFDENGFSSLSSKVEFKFSPKEGVSAGMKGTFKMRRDSCMIFSVQPFAGIEAVKCLIRKDSLFIVSRLHKTYAVEDLSKIENAKYLNLELIQALLSNRVFVPGIQKPTEKDLSRFENHKVKSGNYYRWPNEDYILDFCINDEGQYNQLKVSNPEKQEKVDVTYTLFQDQGTSQFPSQISISTEGFKKPFKFQMTYLKPSFETSTSFLFEIPSKYKKVTTEELIKKFQGML